MRNDKKRKYMMLKCKLNNIVSFSIGCQCCASINIIMSSSSSKFKEQPRFDQKMFWHLAHFVRLNVCVLCGAVTMIGVLSLNDHY